MRTLWRLKRGVQIMKDNICVTRKTTESVMTVRLSATGLPADYRKLIKTHAPFFSHMLEHIAWRSGITVETDFSLDEYNLNHVIYEDLGITLGKALRAFVWENREAGAAGYGDGIGIIDEARALCAVSFEERAYFTLDTKVSIPETTENVLSEDLETFLEGICQGAQCTLHISLESGRNGHHIWEAVFRALGIALGRALYRDPARKNRSAGVAGAVSFTVE
ncbi:MAG: hypothetical protein E7414_05450 [Ruminococcaceae bacterium]|nr:hypothetical protein [Oscillospiraceae bacterium]